MTRAGAPDLDPEVYRRAARMFTWLRRVLRVNLALHAGEGAIEQGDIFLFNHFARFETFIPQYLIHLRTGALCRSIASAEFFGPNDQRFTRFLHEVGAVPNNRPDLLPFLAAEILRGRKVVVFPEGGIVKDRRVLEENGEFSVYSRTAERRRKHHRGAAVLALGLDAFKFTVREAARRGAGERLRRWADALGLQGGAQALLAAARRPTLVVPSNITFYPIRVDQNLLHRTVSLFSRGLPRRLLEELLIESNLLLRDTDMDIRLGEPLRAEHYWRGWERWLVARNLGEATELAPFFALRPRAERTGARLVGRAFDGHASRLRDESMRRMYASVSVHLSHLASMVLLGLLERGQREVDAASFHRLVFLALKYAQGESDMWLHDSLQDPGRYADLPEGRCEGLRQLLATAERMDLVHAVGGEGGVAGAYRIGAKLRAEHEFDRVRLENLILVYANEAAGVSGARRAVGRALADGPGIAPAALAALRFDDEQRLYARDLARATHDGAGLPAAARRPPERPGAPFLLRPAAAPRLGVVLVHGLFASPAEVHGFGERLCARGHLVLGVRLRGHGTTAADLRQRSWQDWYAPVRRARAIVAALAPRVAVVGFSTGAALGLRLAAEEGRALAGVAAIAAPLRFRDRNLRFVPLVHGANRLVQWVSSFEGVMPFRPNVPEHPDINYHQIPIRALYELRRLVETLEGCLGRIRAPTMIVQGEDDPVVDARSARLLYEALEAADRRLVMVPSNRHGILYENIGATQEKVLDFVDEIAGAAPTL